MENPQTIAVEFASAGETCAGDLFIPRTGSPPYPCIVMANGFSGTKDWILPDFARHFAARGMAVLTFDYRRLGASDGHPRQVIDIDAQSADLDSAIAFAKTLSEVNPKLLGLWGTSLGGSYVLRRLAAADDIRAAVLNAPAIDAVAGANIHEKARKVGASPLTLVTTSTRLLLLGAYDALRGALGWSPRYLKVYGPAGKALFTDPALEPLFERLERNSPHWKNQVAARFILKPPRYTKGTMERINTPMLFCLAEQDVEVSSDYVKAKARLAPDATVKVYPAAHFDLYHPPMLDQVLADQFTFLAEHLLSQRR